MATGTACKLALVRWVMGHWLSFPHSLYQEVWGLQHVGERDA